MKVISIASVLLTLATSASAHGSDPILEYQLHQHHPVQQDTGEEHTEQPGRGDDPVMTANEHHLKEHLKEKGYLDADKMSESEKQYHYFLAHDYDGDEELDGTEILQSYFHGDDAPLYKEEELAYKIDYLLDNFDSDRNGKMNFAEFMISSARFMD